jgi:hypothetical protein
LKGVLVETDLIAAFLTAPAGSTPLLRRLLEVVPCYSTFIQAAEIYSVTTDDEERHMAERALFGLKILGASGRYAKTIGDILSSPQRTGGHRTAIVAAMAIESDIPVVTEAYYKTFSEIPRLRVITASTLYGEADRASLLAAVMRAGG